MKDGLQRDLYTYIKYLIDILPFRPTLLQFKTFVYEYEEIGKSVCTLGEHIYLKLKR